MRRVPAPPSQPTPPPTLQPTHHTPPTSSGALVLCPSFLTCNPRSSARRSHPGCPGWLAVAISPSVPSARPRPVLFSQLAVKFALTCGDGAPAPVTDMLAVAVVVPEGAYVTVAVQAAPAASAVV